MKYRIEQRPKKTQSNVYRTKKSPWTQNNKCEKYCDDLHWDASMVLNLERIFVLVCVLFYLFIGLLIQLNRLDAQKKNDHEIQALHRN